MAGSSKGAAAVNASSQPTPLPATPPTTAAPSNPSPSGFCSLHIRLFDGTSIRSKFSADATLSTAVRTFVSESSGTDVPFNFRLMDLPRENRTIEISEEGQSLRDLGLCPNATLVLVPVRDFTDAYASNGAMGVVQKGVSFGVNVVSGAFSLVGGIIGNVTGYNPSQGETEGPYIAGTGDDPSLSASKSDGKQAAGPSTDRPAIRITTLADQRAKEDTEFYNGNQLSVEPRPDDK